MKINQVQRPRPLSPHLQVYKPQLTSVLSISHRGSGIALAIGGFVLVYLFVAAALSESTFNTALGLFRSWIGLFCLFGWTICYFYNILTGIRHLFWDTGRGFELSTAYKTGWLSLAGTTGLTAYAWYYVATYWEIF